MVESGHLSERKPVGISYSPQRRHPNLPVEVLDRSELIPRISNREAGSRQRSEFHQLVVCTSGTGTHHVDFEPIPMKRGTLLRIHPGQVHQFDLSSDFDALMAIWPTTSHHPDPQGRSWYPGSTDATRWNVDDELLARVLGWIDDLRVEQDQFVDSERHVDLMKTLLCTLLLRLAIEVPESLPSSSNLPAPYLAFRERIEERLYERPGVTDLARDLGYSSRTLDRACQQVSDQTAKQVLDERVALEVRRLLTHTDRSITGIASSFGFDDTSNFSKFVKRHLGELPRQIRLESR